jgi:hypothetical protein
LFSLSIRLLNALDSVIFLVVSNHNSPIDQNHNKLGKNSLLFSFVLFIFESETEEKQSANISPSKSYAALRMIPRLSAVGRKIQIFYQLIKSYLRIKNFKLTKSNFIGRNQ